MKAKFYLTFIIASSLFTSVLFAQTDRSGLVSLSTPSSSRNAPATATDDWFTNASAWIRDFEYDFRPAGLTSFRAISPGYKAGYLIQPDGYTAYPMRADNTEPNWEVKFSLQSVGRDKAAFRFKEPVSTENGSEGLVQHFRFADVEYRNNEKGLRQNFIIYENPGGKGHLRLRLSLQSQLTAKLVNQQSLVFADKATGATRLIYEELKVWDANHQVLDAHMELDEKGKAFSIIVNDENAVYPVTIDPLNKTTDWSTSANGLLPGVLNTLALQVNTLYGYNVTGLGDINNDGFEDVAVGAPGMADVLSGSGSILSVGAVFIYLGSATGLATTPAHTLQPTAALLASGLFGFSVAAGDVTGDGLPDIIVGAPLESVSLTFPIFGAITGRVGRVHVYNATNISGPHPTTSVDITLSTGELSNTSITVNALLGFSVGVTGDMNGDGKGEIVAGAPTFARLSGLANVKTGGAFVYLSNPTNTFTTRVSLNPPTGSLLGLSGALQSIIVPLLGQTVWDATALLLGTVLDGQVSGLLFGYSVEGAGAYTSDAIPDVVVGAPAGVSLAVLTGGIGGLSTDVANILSGQVLGGSAYVFAGTGNAAGVNTGPAARLQASTTGLLGSAANLFGYSLRGVRDNANARTGNILVGAPSSSVLSNVVGALQLKAGTVSVFAKQTGPITNPVGPLQTLTSPRQSSVLSLLTGQPLNLSLMFGASMDNMRDINCDTYPDIIVGEPLTTNVPLIGANVTGGAAYILLGRPDGTYQQTPVHWTLTTTVSPLLGINETALLGFSVAGAKTWGTGVAPAQATRAIVGGPANSLDFGVGLLNLGNTVGTLLGFAADANGLGKAYSFNGNLCGIVLPATMVSFNGKKEGARVLLDWLTVDEQRLSHYEVERSFDGVTFTKIAEVTAKDQQRNNYLFPDEKPVFGNNYYRLKVMDDDGKYVYSNTVVVKFDQKSMGLVTIAPNPAQQQVSIRLTGFEKGEYTLRLFNTAGILFETRKINLREHQQTEVMNRNRNIVPGVYMVTLHDENNNKLSTVRLIFNEQ
ncbi:FG-GAP-like repeat-containing protein [Terrimonas sp. NA20]|uniref:FG-GAP-like repeat-containing protein n=1 Tax=Terrimonas ginsenosidimutans TaxID=2908004 RepID=A0ABS9KT71_9BACT|nr:FG-GAP-like repeat-containing protein [Terrimonas ginsenosidimutans]MCG2615532.1 FG-GAP-like repeat-containing protein [Terrimonas ginsenosidimutans]